jgi:hypothetical protein
MAKAARVRVAVKPALLRWARDRAGLQLEQLARRFARVIVILPDECVNYSSPRARLIPGELPQVHVRGEAAEYVAVLIGGHAFRHLLLRV